MAAEAPVRLVSVDAFPRRYPALTFPVTVRTFEPVSLVDRFEPRVKEDPEIVFEPLIAPTSVVADTVDADMVFEPAIAP